MCPASYRAPSVGDDKERTYAQSSESNMRVDGGNAKVADILAEKSADVLSTSPGATVESVVKTLAEKRIGVLTVLENDSLVGIISERDIVRQLGAKGGGALALKVADVMTANPITCKSSDSHVDVLTKMTDGRFRHMPVVDQGRMIGMISLGDVIKHRLAEIEYDNLRLKQLAVG